MEFGNHLDGLFSSYRRRFPESGQRSESRSRLTQQLRVDIMRQKHLELADRHKINIVHGQRTNRRICLRQSCTKISRVFSFWPERGNLQRVKRIKLDQQLFGGAKLWDREDKRTQHPRISRAQILRLIL